MSRRPAARILATDLDGTFLGGDEAARRRLYRHITDHRDALTLIFVTGRDLPFVQRIIDEGQVPRPEYIIGDVGTSIVDGETFTPIEAVQRWVDETWGAASDRVKAMLEGTPGLTLQPTPFTHRVSYYYDPQTLPDDVPERVRQAGFDCILSADVYLDVLPKGVHKGSALSRLLDVLGLPRSRTLVAGDTLNDLALFQTGLDGVAVGGSEPRLLEAIRDLPKTWHAPGVGCAGIWQALERLGHFQEINTHRSAAAAEGGLAVAEGRSNA